MLSKVKKLVEKEMESKKVSKPIVDFGTNEDDLFDNPMVREARAAIPEAEKERYKLIGEQIHSIDYEGDGSSDPEKLMTEGLAYLEVSLRSGLHPSMMTDSDHALMREMCGEEWYTRWGYIEADLKEIVTLTPKLPSE